MCNKNSIKRTYSFDLFLQIWPSTCTGQHLLQHFIMLDLSIFNLSWQFFGKTNGWFSLNTHQWYQITFLMMDSK